MIFAQIKDGIVKNTIVLDDLTLLDHFGQDFDAIIRIDEMDPQPGIDWSYDGEAFTPPVDAE